ncbi:TPA: helix-turn-helix domain-containing protein [Escherichia coli]|uniref:helix-turn-helix domain-containing protein n=1 Tax=Enterobacteriaceae TaxID=543 RepID=UPI000F83EE21|nr:MULTISPECIES: helix-turn-helix domain-containing protein [Enterobacteriaceae]MCK2309156.1 helix-turn-helix domain-containing protein [Escherichia coli]MCV8053988.1 helix-turn-helix domain-containing protein [Escherichia coli]MCZ5655813.1 helix-turn-helix domain-containing protein [Escherichia coli]MDF9105083.1 helix-turn-helix domain-containing protein [Escherichia coli]RTY60699.1 helix-turn-helix domain-containing protein [Shigella sonnei]
MKKETNAFIMVDKRVAQFPKTLKPIDRLVYFTMLDGADYYESKFGRYAPSIDYLMVMSGATRNTVIDSLKRLESHGLIEKTNVKGQQSIFKVFTLDERPEVLSEPTLDERRRVKLSGQPESDTNPTKNWLPTQPEFGYLPNQNLDTCKTKYKDKNINTEEERLKGNFEEESLKKGASLCDSHECDIKEDDFLSLDELNDFLSMNESGLDSEATKEAVKKEDKISDVNIDSDHKNTQCPATDDEMDPFDDYLDEESEREKAIKRVEKKKRFELARQKNKVSGLDPFDDSDDDDFSFTPRKKQTQDDKKQKIKPKMYFAGEGMR